MTPAGIEPATVRFIAQHLNHCSTAVPLVSIYFSIIYSSHFQVMRIYETIVLCSAFYKSILFSCLFPYCFCCLIVPPCMVHLILSHYPNLFRLLVLLLLQLALHNVCAFFIEIWSFSVGSATTHLNSRSLEQFTASGVGWASYSWARHPLSQDEGEFLINECVL